ncbi:pilus assembly protein [Amantichitinum ursilacus]|uniref:Neisseria PilC protein n=1 Tax=Amantichitinum ursilacus TaxID=857265 RepID=A0A0N0XHZ9_9NEIS|nr:PilC/PilY family type IV pilus protein [Amantichitinum ursilacus]KPC52148.1 Neisseria PilC protein [Amantichitinum ursilacus]
MTNFNYSAIAGSILLAMSGFADAASLSVSENFSLSAAQNNWTPLGAACLTAGNNQPSSTATSVIPACATNLGGGATGTLPDTSGNGALRFTSKGTYQHGAIIYNNTFPTDQGIQVTFTAYTYNGSGDGGTTNLGADGISFFLLDGSKTTLDVGATGGSLGYSCSNGNALSDGITGGYLGLGIDEWGNFWTGPGDNTATPANGTRTPNSIVVRGGGSVNAATFAANGWGTYNATDIQGSCLKGYPVHVTTSGNNKVYTAYKDSSGKTPTILDYPYIKGTQLSSSTTPLAQSTVTRRTGANPVTYKLKITPGGKLSLWYTYNGGAQTQIITNQDILDSTVSGPLPPSFRFGFSGGTGGSTNVHELTCFLATPATQEFTGASVNAIKGTQVQEGAQVYQTQYHPDNWWGEVTANSVVLVNGVPALSTAAVWDGSCTLTGGSCSAMSDGTTTPTVTKQTTRTVITSNGSGVGTAFTWNGLTSTQRTALAITGESTTVTQNRVSFLRGDRSQEPPPTSNPFRLRTSVLGDITDSSPVWVGAPNKAYGSTWVDALFPAQTASETNYTAYTTTNATRTNVVYTGSNDGMLHGFRAGSYNASGVFDTSTNDGVDILGYVPASVIGNLNALTNPTYDHAYFVDAPPATGDLYYSNAWHSWVVGGLGPGGKAVYALEVTDPTTFSENNAASIVKGEWTDSTISALNSSIGGSVGYTYGAPLIRRMHNGSWAVIFGSGWNSSGNAGIFIMVVNASNGTISPKFLSTGKSGSTAGITYVASADLDNDHIVDYLYAGDLAGNIWRFDVTSSNPADWITSTYGGTVATPLFTAASSTGTLQPVSTQVQVSSIKVGSSNRIFLMFGTGQRTPFTNSLGDVYASGRQSVYGIWDWDLSAWNSGRRTTNSVTIPASTTAYVAGTAPAAGSAGVGSTVPRSALVQQTSTETTLSSGSVGGYRVLSNNAVCWQDSTTCTTGNSNYGWYYDLPTTGEQVIANPVINDGALELNTIIPPPSSTATCTVQLPTGWTMAYNPLTGGTFTAPFFPNIASDSAVLVQGAKLNASGSVTTLTVSTSTGTVSATVGNNLGGTPVCANDVSKCVIVPVTDVAGQRITWKETQ